jgi:putative membrane protein
MDDNKQKKTSDHLANERTFLAWIRTGIGIMAFGFVVVKFSLFVKQLTAVLGKQAMIPQRGVSSILGIGLVALGLLTTGFAYLRFIRTRREIETDTYGSATGIIVVLVGLIVVFGLLLIAYLIENT